MKENKTTFETSLKRLEEIVSSLEKGNVSLEDAISLFEEGIRTAKACTEKHKTA